MLEILSRIQFAFTAAFHFIFVPLTIGLIFLIAVYEGIYFFKKKTVYRDMANFWSKIFIINFTIGVVTGIVMAVQFGTNWARYSVFMGDIFGSPLAIEALLAFFLESTFVGIWVFKRNVISDGLRFLTVSLIAIGTTLSAIWIITANAFMQHPVGYSLLPDGSKVVLTDFWALLKNTYMHYTLAHTLAACLAFGAFFVIGVSAYHLKRRNNIDFFKKSAKVAVIIGIIAVISLPAIGTSYAKYIGQKDVQPIKGLILRTGSMEIQENTGKEGEIDANSAATLEKVKEKAEANSGLRKPPENAIYMMYNVMQWLGYIMAAFLVLALIRPKWLEKSFFFQRLSMWLVPVPFLAITLGWMVTEIGRQPWMVYNLMTVEDGISQVPVGSVIFSLFTLFVVYAILLALDIVLIKKEIVKGPRITGGEK